MNIAYTDAIGAIMRESRAGAVNAVMAEGGKGGSLLSGQAKMACPGGDTASNDSYDADGELYAGFVVGRSLCGDKV
jgi:hypothetical protein